MNKNNGLSPYDNVYFLALFKTLLFGSRNLSFLSKIWKKMFSDLIIPKTKMKRNSIFGQKPWSNPLEKCRSWNFLTVQFSGLKIIFFSIHKLKKWSLPTCFIQKKINKKKYDFWTKTMDYPLRKMSIFSTF